MYDVIKSKMAARGKFKAQMGIIISIFLAHLVAISTFQTKPYSLNIISNNLT